MYCQKYFYIITCLISLLVVSCKEEIMEPLPNNDKLTEPVSNIRVENINGGAILTYDLPKDKNAKYVEAVWETSKGVRTVKASTYNNSMTVEGFGDTNEYEITLYTVNLVEKKSDPVVTTIKPLAPPVDLTFASLGIQEDFGGMTIAFENPAKSDLVISVLAPDSTGLLQPVHDFYTGLPNGTFAVRGLPPVTERFGFFVRDRWDNHSDTLYMELTPIYEELLDKSKFAKFDLPGDMQGNYLNPMHGIWDNNQNTIMHTYTYNAAQMPNVAFAFDMGASAKLSRFKLWQRYHDSYTNIYNTANFKEFEVWGTNEIPDMDGSWDNWTKLMDCEVIKPSGLPRGQYSNDDVEAMLAGHEFIFPLDAPVVRFIRIKVTKNWGDYRWIFASEITFWGAPQ